MPERLIGKTIKQTDKYLRNPNTRLARGLQHAVHEKGEDYLLGKKRALIDRGVAIALSVPVIPVVGVLAIAKKLEDGGPSFYKSPRVGKGGEIFNAIKIRTLYEGADQSSEGNSQNATTPGIPFDSRATKLGQWMRKNRLDDIPQVVQAAFGGHMSFFGVRAASEKTWEAIREHLPKKANASYERYIKTKPGSLNPQGVLYRHGTLAESERLNSFYTSHASLGLDLYLFFRAITRRWLTTRAN